MSTATHEDSDGTGYCRGCGTTIGESHHVDCDLLEARRLKAAHDADGQSTSQAPLGCWKLTLDDKRTITAWDLGGGSFAFRFQNEDNTTTIRLSREAVNALKVLMLCKVNGIDA